MNGTYDYRLVALSIAVAIMASYTALELSARVSQKQTHARATGWLVGGAIAMGAGIWSMHFVGMLAFHLPVPVAYDAELTLLSMVWAIAVSGVALLYVRRPDLTRRNVSVGAALMGAGICAMHYTGMAAMRMSPPIQYDPLLFLASVLIAISASMAALWLAFNLRHRHSGIAVLAKCGSAGIMGLAIAGMHYTGMAAADFEPGSVCLAAGVTGGLTDSVLAVAVGIASLGMLSVTLVISALDAHFAAHTAKLADSLQNANDQLRNLALYDDMTRLPNRMLLQDRVAQALSGARRRRGTFALLFVDLDRFKPVNDTYGHRIGDALLLAVAGRLQRCVREADTVARVGGDEFVFLLTDLVEANDAALIAGKVLGELARPFFVENIELSISCSVGISVYPGDGKDMDTLMIKADAAMYQAKREGKNGYRYFLPGMEQQASGSGPGDALA